MKVEHPDFGSLPSTWSVLTLGDVADVTKLAGFEFTKHIKYLEDGEIIALRSLNVCDGQLDLSKAKRISKDASNALPRSKLFVGDLLLTYTGSKLGDTAIIDCNDKYHLAPNVCRLRAINDTDAYFLYLYMRSAVFIRILDNFKVGSGQPTVPMKNIRKIPIPWPCEDERNLICDVYKSLNNKIVTNVSINISLEEIAKAIFKSWFVDFDPIKAKMRGELPEGMDAATAALFTDKLVESELGLIPEGWEVKSFSDWVKITKGKNITKKTVIEGDIPVVAGGLKPAYFHNTHNVEGPAITISASGANAGFVSLYFQNIWASDCSYISESTTPFFYLQYVFLVFNQKKIFGMQTGAAQPHIYPRDFERLMVVIPNEELCIKLENIFASFFRGIANNKAQNIELSQLRDTLLPKLLSGERELTNLEPKDES
jgi:type I restriction enzyme S subunit